MLTLSYLVNLLTSEIRISWAGAVTDDVIIKVIDPQGTILYKNAGYDTNTFTSPDSSGVNTGLKVLTVYNEDAATGYPIAGYYTVYYKLGLVRGVEYSNRFYFCPDAIPKGELDVTHSCRFSELTALDITDYTYSCNGQNSSPIGYDNTQITIKYPTTTPVPHADDVSGLYTMAGMSFTTQHNLWTGLFVIQFTNDVLYQITQPDGTILTINATITAQTTHQVSCLSECACAMLVCLTAIYNRYINETQGSPSKESLRETITKLSFLQAELTLAIECGNEEVSSDICAKLRAIINDADCTCLKTLTSGKSTEIIPLDGGGSGTIVYYNNIHAGNYPDEGSLSGVGKAGDIAIDNSGTGNWYKNVNGNWIKQGSFNGADGSDATGAYILKDHSVTEYPTPGNTSKNLLLGLSLKAVDLTALPDLSYAKVTLKFKFAVNSHKKTIFIEMVNNSSTIESYEPYFDYNIDNTNKYVSYVIIMNKIDGSNQTIETEGKQYGLFASEILSTDTTTMDLTKDININISGQTNVTSSPGDITLINAKVEYFKKI